MIPRPTGILVIGALLLFGSALAIATGISLVHPGTFLDLLWALNRPAYSAFASLRRPAGLALFVIAVATTLTGLGLLKGKKWAWRLTVAIFALNIAGDVVRLAADGVIKGALGLAIAVGFLVYLTRPGVRTYFRNAG